VFRLHVTFDDEVAWLSAMIEFYSNKSNTHASFVVAGVFGMYALLALVSAGKVSEYLGLILIAYIALLIIDVYEFLNFGQYGVYSEFFLTKLRDKLHGQSIQEEDVKTKNVKGKYDLGRTTWYFHRFRNIVKGRREWAMLSVLWACAVVLPLIVVYLTFR
jgi:hypothetical protein